MEVQSFDLNYNRIPGNQTFDILVLVYLTQWHLSISKRPILRLIIQHQNIYYSGNTLVPVCWYDQIKIPTQPDVVLCIEFNFPFNTFQVISGWCLLVTKSMINHLYCHHSRMIPCLIIIYSGNANVERITKFLHWTTLYMWSIRQVTLNYNFKSLVWLGRVLNQVPPRHRANTLPRDYRCWSTKLDCESPYSTVRVKHDARHNTSI